MGQITITGTVLDPNNVPYSGGTGRAQLVTTSGSATSEWTVNNGYAVNQPLVSIFQLTSGGVFSVNLFSTADLDQQSAAPQWQFTFSSAPYLSPTTIYNFIMTPMALTTGQDISAQIKAQSAVLPTPFSSQFVRYDVAGAFTAIQTFVLNSIPVNDLVAGTDGQVLGTVGSTVEWINSPAFSGADKALDNLAAVAINTDLLPGVAGGVDLGSTTLPFDDLVLGGAANETLSFNTSGLSGNRVWSIPDRSDIPALLGANQDFTGNVVFQNQVGLGATMGTAPLSVTSTTVVSNLNVEVINGVTVSGAATSGKVLVATSSSAATWSSSAGTPIQQYYSATLSGTQNITATTLTEITQAQLVITMPSSGGPWRIDSGYYMTWHTGATPVVDMYMTDGTDKWAWSEVQFATSGSNQAGQNARQVSPNTYANGASVTLRLMCEPQNNITIEPAPLLAGPNANSFAVIVASN